MFVEIASSIVIIITNSVSVCSLILDLLFERIFTAVVNVCMLVDCQYEENTKCSSRTPSKSTAKNTWCAKITRESNRYLATRKAPLLCIERKNEIKLKRERPKLEREWECSPAANLLASPALTFFGPYTQTHSVSCGVLHVVYSEYALLWTIYRKEGRDKWERERERERERGSPL